MRPAATGLILSAAVGILITTVFGTEIQAVSLANLDVIALILACSGFIVLQLFKAPLLLVIAACGAVGGVLYTLL